MKRLLALLLILCLLAGCGVLPAPDAEVPEDHAASEPQPEPPQAPPAMLDGKQPVDGGDALCYVPNEAIEAGSYTSITVFGKDLLVSGSSGGIIQGDVSEDMITGSDYLLTMIDGDTGAVLHEAELPGVYATTVQVCGEQIAVCDESAGTVYLYDDSLTLLAKYIVADEWCSVFLDPAATRAYCVTYDEGVQVIEFESGTKSTLLENSRGLYVDVRCGQYLTLQYIDGDTQMNETAALDLATGELLSPPFSADLSLLRYNGTYWLGGLNFAEGRYLCGMDGNPDVIDAKDSYLSLLAEPDGILASFYDADEKTHYALYAPDGTFSSACTVDMAKWGYFTGDPVYSAHANGFYILAVDAEGVPHLLFWDLNQSVDGENFRTMPLSEAVPEPEPGSAVAAELYERAAELSERFGVNILIAEQPALEYTDYTTVHELDYWKITAALDALESALSAFPDGFFRQLVFGSYRETEINLVGALYPVGLPEDEVNGFTSFAAFVENTGSKHIMTLDIGQGSALEDNVFHETSHIIDAKLDFDAMYFGSTAYSEDGWAACNPPDFTYICDYYELPEGVESDGYDSYFIDTYARTFPTEDRARVFEYAMGGYAWCFNPDTCAPLRAKLEYYSQCIREAFDTTGWPETTRWELPLREDSEA